MTDRRLYVLDIPSDAQTRSRGQGQQRLSTNGLLGSDTGSVDSIATEPSDQRLTLQFRDPLAEEMAHELEELADASAINAIPYYGDGTATPSDGYYAVSQRTSNRADPRASEVVDFEASLTKQGTRSSHHRAVQARTSQIDHPFGNDDRALVGVPGSATDVQWYTAETGETASAAPVATRTAELGDVDVYDAQAAPYSDPQLIYEIPYDGEGGSAGDVRVWDEHGRGDRTDASGVLQWEKCFSTAHQFDGEAVLSNWLVRLRIDQSAPSLTVEHYDASADTWSETALGTSDWGFHALDIREIGMAQVRARVTFRDPTQPATYSIDCWLARGYTDPLWAEVDSPIPTGLADLLDPAAAAQIIEPGSSKTLVGRTEVQ